MLKNIHVHGQQIGERNDYPIGVSRDLPKFRLLDMYTACTHPAVKETILLSLFVMAHYV